MKKEKQRPSPISNLRRRAVKQLKEGHIPVSLAPDVVELRRLVHELQVHQIELEMQNEELGDAHAEIAALLAKYTGLYDFAPVGFLTLNGAGVVQEANLAAAALLGVDRTKLLQQSLERFVVPADRAPFRALLTSLGCASGKEICEVELLSSDGERRYVRMDGSSAKAGAGDAPAAYHLAMLDISESQQMKMELLRHASELQHALDHIRKLQGILPICSYCHRIRNDQHLWEQLEEYISSHSEVKFSHGICSACMAEHFPENMDKK